MNREIHVRFWERAGVRFPCATQHPCINRRPSRTKPLLRTACLLTGTTLGSVTTAMTYNAFGEPETTTAKYGSSTLFATDYTRDKLGRITSKAETVQGVTTNYDYRYDVVGRLVETKENGVIVASYQFDQNSNRNGGFNKLGTISASYDAQDRLARFGSTTFRLHRKRRIADQKRRRRHQSVRLRRPRQPAQSLPGRRHGDRIRHRWPQSAGR